MLNFFKNKSYHSVSTLQLIIMSVVTGIVSACVVIINMIAVEYVQLPIVVTTELGQCVSVLSFNNGEAYACSDVDKILRKYRTEVIEGTE